jgi:hypothetical protein
MNRYRVIASALAAAVVSTIAFADASPPGYHDAMIAGGGQADAVGVVCGKITEARAIAHKAELKKMFVAKGVAPAKFEAIYSGGYNQVKAGAKANPAQTRQACERLAKGSMAGR